MPPLRTRLATAKLQNLANKKAQAEQARQIVRRELRLCQNPLCHKSARCGCRLCPGCFQAQKLDKDDALVLCQGCPQLASDFEMIRWGKGDPLMAKWLVSNVELVLDEASHGLKVDPIRWVERPS
jgi:hypothetical protein